MSDNTKGFWRATGETLGFVAPSKQQHRAVDGPAAGVIPPARTDVPFMSPDLALSIGAVYRSVSIITTSVSQMSLGVYRDDVELKTPTIIKQPNVNDTQTAFIEETVYSLAAYGNAYWRVFGDPIANVVVLDPNSVTITEESGRRKYWVGTTEVPSNQIRHMKLFRKPGQLKGFGPIQQGQSELIAALKLRRFADNWFGGSSIPTGMLTTDQVLSPQEAKEFAEAWTRFINDNGGTAVLSQGMTYDYLSIKPAEAQFLEIQMAQVNAIARLFGVPAVLLGSGLEGTSTTYVNAQELNIQFLQTTLVKYMNEIENAFSTLLPRGQTVEFKEDSLLRMNTVMQVDVQEKQIAAGLRTANEIRKTEGLPPLATPKPVAPAVNPNESSEENGND